MSLEQEPNVGNRPEDQSVSGNRNVVADGSGIDGSAQPKSRMRNRQNRQWEGGQMQFEFIYAEPSGETQNALEAALDIIMRHGEEQGLTDTS